MADLCPICGQDVLDLHTLSAAEAAQFLGCLRSELVRLGNSGRLPYIRATTRMRRYKIRDLQLFVAKREAGR